MEPAEAPPKAATSLLFNPSTFDPPDLDDESRRILRATIEFFESRGKEALKRDDHERVWYSDFLEFVKRERVFATLLTPAAEGGGDAEKRWDTTRICAFNEITGFYGLAYWYTWQVSILGLGPIWQSENAAARARAAELLESGAIFSFGLTEREHGADIYSTDMLLTPNEDGDITSVTINQFLDALEAEIDKIDASDAEREEARGIAEKIRGGASEFSLDQSDFTSSSRWWTVS